MVESEINLDVAHEIPMTVMERDAIHIVRPYV